MHQNEIIFTPAPYHFLKVLVRNLQVVLYYSKIAYTMDCMWISVRSTFNHSQQGQLREEVLGVALHSVSHRRMSEIWNSPGRIHSSVDYEIPHSGIMAVRMKSEWRGTLNMIETESLILDKAKFSDWAEMYHNVWSQPESARYMEWSITTSEEAAKTRIEKTIAFQKEHDTYLVYEKASGKAIGFAGVEQIEPHLYQETGICLGPNYVGKGFGKQILQVISNYKSSYPLLHGNNHREFLIGINAFYGSKTAVLQHTDLVLNRAFPVQFPAFLPQCDILRC